MQFQAMAPRGLPPYRIPESGTNVLLEIEPFATMIGSGNRSASRLPKQTPHCLIFDVFCANLLLDGNMHPDENDVKDTSPEDIAIDRIMPYLESNSPKLNAYICEILKKLHESYRMDFNVLRDTVNEVGELGLKGKGELMEGMLAQLESFRQKLRSHLQATFDSIRPDKAAHERGSDLSTVKASLQELLYTYGQDFTHNPAPKEKRPGHSWEELFSEGTWKTACSLHRDSLARLRDLLLTRFLSGCQPNGRVSSRRASDAFGTFAIPFGAALSEILMYHLAQVGTIERSITNYLRDSKIDSKRKPKSQHGYYETMASEKLRREYANFWSDVRNFMEAFREHNFPQATMADLLGASCEETLKKALEVEFNFSDTGIPSLPSKNSRGPAPAGGSERPVPIKSTVVPSTQITKGRSNGGNGHRNPPGNADTSLTIPIQQSVPPSFTRSSGRTAKGSHGQSSNDAQTMLEGNRTHRQQSSYQRPERPSVHQTALIPDLTRHGAGFGASVPRYSHYSSPQHYSRKDAMNPTNGSQFAAVPPHAAYPTPTMSVDTRRPHYLATSPDPHIAPSSSSFTNWAPVPVDVSKKVEYVLGPTIRDAVPKQKERPGEVNKRGERHVPASCSPALTSNPTSTGPTDPGKADEGVWYTDDHIYYPQVESDNNSQFKAHASQNTGGRASHDRLARASEQSTTDEADKRRQTKGSLGRGSETIDARSKDSLRRAKKGLTASGLPEGKTERSRQGGTGTAQKTVSKSKIGDENGRSRSGGTQGTPSLIKKARAYYAPKIQHEGKNGEPLDIYDKELRKAREHGGTLGLGDPILVLLPVQSKD
ncbi:hypothetical protein BJ508DRAFT_340177 [Ascobolus immersus RN42]|uniref:Uncharacterized protein n=1 Tax=Ascobolus immersus RN42 TaxID=1160509 RepID=A0A3N4HRK7_ASCIM|nr:hypothetical protein BJ508DRAFT_340177 [Ascobolus immersus RN42]